MIEKDNLFADSYEVTDCEPHDDFVPEELGNSRYANRPLPQENEPGFLDRYDQSVYGVDLALCEGNALEKKDLDAVTQALSTADKHSVFLPFYDPLCSNAHVLVISKNSLYQIAEALSKANIRFSAAPAFLSYEEELGIRTYLYLRLAYPRAQTLKLF